MPRDKPRITIVDDDLVTCELLSEVFCGEGFVTESALTAEAALALIAATPPDVVVSDIRMKSRVDGLGLLDRLRREYPSLPVVLITAFGSIDTAIRAVKNGAFDYLSKPFEIETLVSTVRRAIATTAAPSPPDDEAVDDEGPGVGTRHLVGRTPAMLAVYKMVARVADADAPVLISGESGTGKELVARAIHANGAREPHPFVAVNCGALTETLLDSELFGHIRGSFTGATTNRRGLFEEAGAGTIFLDEIAETSPALQVKLLRVLQEREVVPVGGSSPVVVRARVIAASNTDLDRLSRAGGFRRDLLYRLNVVNIHLPALRERAEDVPLLAAHFLRKYAADRSVPIALSEPAKRVLEQYAWPGNVRELENAIERSVTLGQGCVITVDDLPPAVRQTAADTRVDSGDPTAVFAGLPTIDEMERRYVLHVLEAAGGNRTHASEILGINRRTLYRMAARLRLEI